MTEQPLLSYIVLSYNYESYIAQTIRSILEQSVQDFEIVVVDDCSSDRSCEVVRSFGDPRIRLIVNDQNLGGAGAYNRAVEAACGTWLVNLDADDWILPRKAEAQLAHAAIEPSLDVIGTYVAYFDAAGQPHPDAARYEAHVNIAHDLNRVDSWIGRNSLCRSSTMVRRDAHLRAGLDDPTMVRAPDYELWTRFLRQGSRFAILPEKLTCCRLQGRGVTFGDPLTTMLEMAWAGARNLVPTMESRSLWPSYDKLLRWLTAHVEFANLDARTRERLIAFMVSDNDAQTFAGFRAAIGTMDPVREALGRRLIGVRDNTELVAQISTLHRAITSYVEARDFWNKQSDAWQAQAEQAQQARVEAETRLRQSEEARSSLRSKCEAEEARAQDLQERLGARKASWGRRFGMRLLDRL